MSINSAANYHENPFFQKDHQHLYLPKKNHVINNKSANKQVHMMKASNNKNLFKSYCGFYTFI